jgi:membrane-associated phospholipid phosphatase
VTAERYARISAPWRTPRRTALLNGLNRATAVVYYLSYPVLVAALLFQRDPRALRCVLVPGLSFVLVSLYRSVRDEKRPYEVLDIHPLIHKDTRGHSFPSRHVFSAFVIAMTFLWIYPPAGAPLLALGMVTALCRVLGGVHWPRDVIAGALLGTAAGLIGYWLF